MLSCEKSEKINSSMGAGQLMTLSQRFGHPRVLGIPIPISLAFGASPVGDAQNADRFDFA